MWRIPSGRDQPPDSSLKNSSIPGPGTAAAVAGAAAASGMPFSAVGPSRRVPSRRAPQRAHSIGRRWTEGDAPPLSRPAGAAAADGAAADGFAGVLPHDYSRLFTSLSESQTFALALAISAEEANAAAANPAPRAEAASLAEKLSRRGARMFDLPHDGNCGVSGLTAALEHECVCAETGGDFPVWRHLAPYNLSIRSRIVNFAKEDYAALGENERGEVEMMLGYSFPVPYTGFAQWAEAMRQSGTYVDDYFFEMAGRCFNTLVVVTFPGDRCDMTFPSVPSRLRPNPRSVLD